MVDPVDVERRDLHSAHPLRKRRTPWGAEAGSIPFPGNCPPVRSIGRGMADPRNTDPEDRDPRERELGRRSEGPAVSPWLVIGSILLLAVAVYVISALM